MGRHLCFSPDLLLYIEPGRLVEISFLKEILHIFRCSGFTCLIWLVDSFLSWTGKALYKSCLEVSSNASKDWAGSGDSFTFLQYWGEEPAPQRGVAGWKISNLSIWVCLFLWIEQWDRFNYSKWCLYFHFILLPKMYLKWENIGVRLIKDGTSISENTDLFVFKENCSICANR